ncbi:unnamed protein product [Ixodes pacificus]
MVLDDPGLDARSRFPAQFWLHCRPLCYRRCRGVPSSPLVPCILRDLTSLLLNLTADSVWNGTDPVLKSW